MPEDIYTHGHQPSVLRSHTWRTVDNSAPHLAPHLRPGLDVLDVGCGPGTITVDLAGRVAPGRVVGIDRSTEVLARATTTARPSGADVEFATGDVYALDFPDGSFDVVHAHQVLQHLSDQVAALVEMRRVCRPGGLVAVRDADYGAFTWAPDDAALGRWLEVYRSVARGNGAEPDAGRYLEEWVRHAGYSEVEAGRSEWRFTDAADREWWGDLWSERVLDSSFAAQALERGVATEADLAEMSAAFRAWALQPAGWFVVPHGEVLARP